MSERINPPARMTVAVPPRGRGRPLSHKTSGLRERAWWQMRRDGKFTLHSIMDAQNDGAESDAIGNVRKYVRALERVGVVVRLARRAPGLAPTSNGHVIWRLARDLGRQAPVWRSKQQALWDPNSSTLIPLPAAKPAQVQP